MKEIAVFGGTFEPPTKAHEAILAACLDTPWLDEVWGMPSGMRPDKPEMLSNAARLAMLQLVKTERFQDDPRLVITDFEQRLPQPTRTYRTVEALRTAHLDRRFWFVYGADAYADMPKWEHGAELRRSLGMLVIGRPGHELPSESDRLKHLVVPDLGGHISSSAFRATCSQGLEAMRQYVSTPVAQYVVNHGLYGLRTNNC